VVGLIIVVGIAHVWDKSSPEGFLFGLVHRSNRQNGLAFRLFCL